MSDITYFRRSNPAEERLTEIEVMIISAQDLKNVKHVTKTQAYAVVYVDKDVHVAKTHVDNHGGVNPVWNEIVKVRFHSGLAENDIMAALNVDVYAHGHLREKLVGSARVLLCDVLKGGDASDPVDNPIQCLMVQLWRPSSRPRGFLNLWVPPTGKFLNRLESSDDVEKEVMRTDDVAVIHGPRLQDLLSN